MPEIGVTGFYMTKLPGSGSGRWWQIYRQVGAGSSHTLDEYWATGFNDDAPTAASNAAAVRTELTTELPRIDVATSVARDDVLDAIDDIEVGSGVGTIIPVSQVPIPTERTWVLKHTGGGLQGELPLVRRVGESQPFAVDWRNDQRRGVGHRRRPFASEIQTNSQFRWNLHTRT